MSLTFIVIFVIGAAIWAIIVVREQDKREERENNWRLLLEEKEREIQELKEGKP